MTGLAKFQQGFSHFLREGDQSPPGLAGSIDSQERALRLYRNNVFFSLTTALGDLYPVIKQLLGEDFFQHMARHYLQRHPPAQAAMVYFASDFPDYLQRDELRTGLAYLTDIASMELARHRAFHARDETGIAPQVFEQVGVEALLQSRFELHPSLQLIQSLWAIHSIWTAHQAEEVKLESIQLDKPESVLILRPDTLPKLYSVDPGLIDFLILIGKGSILEQAVEETVATHTNFDTGAALAFCINHGVFTAFHTDN